jgi:predicted O-methyltransferase YrrM
MKVPYPMVAAVDIQKRHAHMSVALFHDLPRLKQVPINDSQTLYIACYGPSLADNWQELRGKHPLMSMSGSLHFLADRGIIPDYHVDMDPRENKLLDISPPVDGVHYLMASVCPTGTWKILKDQKVSIWHTYSGQETYDWAKVNDKGALVVRGGSTIGLTALHIGGIMGYRHFEIYGMDGSFRDLSRTERHAGVHHGAKDNKDGITWDAGGKTYATSKIMANAVQETLLTIANTPILCVFHGYGLTQALIREKDFPNACTADQVEKAGSIRSARPNLVQVMKVDDEYIARASVWDTLYGLVDPTLAAEMNAMRDENEPRRAKAKYNTGSITLEQMLQLRGICNAQRPRVVAEIGTFIGNSAMAMNADLVYTCDRSNDCFPSTDKIRTFPLQSSTEMFEEMVRRGVKVDLFFFDGRIQPQDVNLILKLSNEKTIYLFDDYNGKEKGTVNAKLLSSAFTHDFFVIPPDDRIKNSTLAAIAPAGMFTLEKVACA